MDLKTFSLCFFVCAVIGCLFFTFGFLLVPNEQFNPDLYPSFRTIFFTNLEIHFFTIFFSVISFGFFSFIFLFQQFFYLGYLFHSLVIQTSLRTAFSFFAGHGVIEVINMFFTAAIGLFVAVNIIQMIRKRNFNRQSFTKLSKTILILLVVDLVLLCIAAVLETYVSPYLVDIDNIQNLYDQ